VADSLTKEDYISITSFDCIITEIMQNPSHVTDSDGEWFEVYNPLNIPVDINGLLIRDADTDNHTVTSSIIIGPGEYKILGNNSNFNTNGGVLVDYQYSGILLGNGTDEIILINPSGDLEDSVAYDGDSLFPDPNGASMALIDPNLDNSVGSNWQESTTPYGDGDLGTPGMPNYFNDINFDSTALDFDTVNVNESGVLSLTIINEGNMPLELDSLYTNSTLFTLSFSDTVIDTTALLQITFTPIELGIVTGTLYILSDDPDESMVEIPLSGFGYYPAPDIVLENTSLNFGDVMDGLTGLESFKIYNIG
ncbi:uncharacterized protein METZ01_LOCUS367610, partial [marine metagenome]